jgi:hypothetical protein
MCTEKSPKKNSCNSNFLLQKQRIGKLSSGGLQNQPCHHDPHLALEHFRPAIVNFCCIGKELVNCHMGGCRIGLTTTTYTWR